MLISNDNTRGNPKLNRIIIIQQIKRVQQLLKLPRTSSHLHRPPHFLVRLNHGVLLMETFKFPCENSQTSNYPEKSHRWSAIERAVSDFCLCRQVVRILNRRYHPLHSQEGSEICCVAWNTNIFTTRRRKYLRDNSADLPRDDNQREKPPDSAHDTSACCLNAKNKRSSREKQFSPSGSSRSLAAWVCRLRTRN